MEPDIIVRVYYLLKNLTEEDKFILIGCDGIWEKYQNEQIANII